MTQTTVRLYRPLTVLLAVLAFLAGAAVVAAPAAHAGEMTSVSTRYVDGKCSKSGPSWLDRDCYHDDLTFAKHSSCRVRMGKLAGVDPDSSVGRYVLGNARWICQAQPPVGRYLLQIWHPGCPVVGWSSAQCRAWAKSH
ncbi:hypothetical protein [Jatrophihabitans fulvus]